jgi:putative iron-regulated protein
MMNRTALFGFVFSLAFVSCKKEDDEPTTPVPTGDSPALIAAKTEAKNNYAEIVKASYEDALTTAETLEDAIGVFLASPSQAGYDACKIAWLNARLPYGQTEVYRFADGPIDDADGPEGLINAWPMDEAYIDYVDGNPTSGIINNSSSYPVINGELLESLNEAGGETNISTGFHAIEFLLWGQDLSSSSAGTRPFTDYTTAPNAARRGQYLEACAELLVGHLDDLVNEWDAGTSGSYAAGFVNGGNNTALAAMLQGIGFMGKGELAGERMFVAWDTQDQEDEHSCFSDNTHNDIRMNAQGMYNVWFGTYTRLDGSIIGGTGLKDVLEIVNNGVGIATSSAISEARDLCFTIPTPFDQAILGANTNSEVYQSILALRNAGDQISVAAATLGLSITVE